MSKNADALCSRLGISFPIIQAGMVWVSGANLAAASSNAGILGVLGAGSMKPDLLRDQIRKVKQLTQKPFAVNVPLLYHGVEEQLAVGEEEGVKIWITSAGTPKRFTQRLKSQGAQVWHVVSSASLAKKCEDAGVDGVICEGFEAGGHNGREELTSLVLIPQVVQAVSIPVVAAGGFATGGGIVAALALGAWGVQMGTAFAASLESSAHFNFKQTIVNAGEDATVLCMKSLVPVRLIKNRFCQTVLQKETQGATSQELQEILGQGRARLGMFEGNIDEGELEIGQACALVKRVESVEEIVERLRGEFAKAKELILTTRSGS